MKKRSLIGFVGQITLILCLLFGAVPVAHAQSEQPPETPPAAEESHPESESESPAEPIASDEVPAEEPQTAVEISDPADPIISDPDVSSPEEPEADPEGLVAQLPLETGLVVEDAGGDPLPLASSEAARVIVRGDPIWCPSGVDPHGGGGGCTSSFSTFTDLIAALQSQTEGVYNYTGAGTIYIAADYDAATAEDQADHQFNHANMAGLTSLTVQGGWDPTKTLAAQTFSSSTIDMGGEYAGLTFRNWEDAVTIRNLTLTNSLYGLTVGTQWDDTSTGDVILENVTVTFSGDQGSTYGASVETAGDVTVRNSVFNNNSGAGLTIYNQGSVSLQDLTANENNLYGVSVNNTTGTSAISVTGDNTFTGNGADGLMLTSHNDITLGGASGDSITASDNGGNGINANTCDMGEEDCQGAGKINMNGTNVASGNDREGVYLFSADRVTVNGSLTAENNGSKDEAGANMYALNGLIFNGTGLFSHNSSDGLIINGMGTISLKNITSFLNGGEGLEVRSYNGDTTLDEISTYSNDDNGIWVIGQVGKITASNVSANSNGRNGIIVQNNSGAISLSQITAGSNEENGISAHSNSAISGSNLTASENAVDGFQARNVEEFDSDWVGFNFGSQDITLTGTNLFQNNGQYGVNIYSAGNIKITGTTVDGSGMDGFRLRTANNITLFCVDTARNNGGYGINASTPGTLTLTGTVFSNNTSGDVNLDDGGTQITAACVPVAPPSGPSNIQPPAPTLPVIVVPAGSGGTYQLGGCGSSRGTRLELGSHDFAELPCGNGGEANIQSIESPTLPAPLETGYRFVSSMTLQVTQNGVRLTTLGNGATVAFKVPAGIAPDRLTILFWDGVKWVPLSGGYFTPDGFFAAPTTMTGTFVLVQN